MTNAAAQATQQVIATLTAALELLRDLMTHEETFTSWLVQVGGHAVYFKAGASWNVGAAYATRYTKDEAEKLARIVRNGAGEGSTAVSTESAILRSIGELETTLKTIQNA